MEQFYLQILNSITSGQDANFVRGIMGQWFHYIHSFSDRGSTVAAFSQSLKMGMISGGYQFLDDKGNSPLAWAAYYGRNDLVMLFAKEYCFMVNRQNFEGETALHFAIKGTSFECVRSLLELGGDVNISNLKGESPLHMAVCAGFEYVEFLVGRTGLVIDQEDDFGETALHWAIREDEMDSVFALLSGGASLYHPNEDGETPSMYVELFGSSSLKRMIQSGAQEETQLSQGNSFTMPMAVDDIDTLPPLSYSADATLGMNNYHQTTPFSLTFFNEYH